MIGMNTVVLNPHSLTEALHLYMCKELSLKIDQLRIDKISIDEPTKQVIISFTDLTKTLTKELICNNQQSELS